MIKNKKEALVSRTLLLPFILVTSLFALWGFANNITEPMVIAFKKVLELSNSKAAWVQMAFYGGYFCMALPAALFIRKYSYKKGVLFGLALYAIGALLFYPAAILENFYFFCFGYYILTFGLAFLETTANPYILAMGEASNATRRLNLSQIFNPVGALSGLYIAQVFVLSKLQSVAVSKDTFRTLDEVAKARIKTNDLLTIRTPYVVLGLAIIVVIVIMLLSKMPEIKTEHKHKKKLSDTFKNLLTNRNYLLSVWAQIFYVGAQIMCWTYMLHYAENIGINNAKAINYLYIAFILFLGGRMLGTYLLKFFSSAQILLFFALCASVCTAISISYVGNLGLYILVLVSLFMSIMFPTIYGIGLEGLSGDEAKIGAAGLVMAIVGGALLPKVQSIIIDLEGADFADTTIMGVPEVNFSFILPLICFIWIAIYAFYILKNNKNRAQTKK